MRKKFCLEIRQIFEKWQKLHLLVWLVIHLLSGVKFLCYRNFCFTSAPVKVPEQLMLYPQILGWSFSFLFNVNFIFLAMQTWLCFPVIICYHIYFLEKFISMTSCMKNPDGVFTFS